MATADAPALNQRSHVGRRLIIDALAARYGGTAYAAIHVARHLAEDPVLGEVVVVARSGSIVAEGIPKQAGLRVLALGDANRFELSRRLTWEALVLPRRMKGTGASLLTWSGMLPRRVPGPVICYLANPAMFQNGGLRNRMRRHAVGRTARYADHVLVPTRTMASLVSASVRCEVEVVPLGVDHDRFVPANSPGNEVLCVADFYPHKRHDLVLGMWALLPEPRPALHLIGDPRVNEFHYRRVCRLVESYRRLGTIIVASRLTLGALLGAYHKARVIVLASEQESFSMPLLESQACGVPAIVRDLPALRETGGDATTYVSGDASDKWARELERLVEDDELHAAFRTRALEHSQRFAWKRTADEVRARLPLE